MGGDDLIDWVFLVIALCIYFDATHHKIGKIPKKWGLLNRSAGGWATIASLSFAYIGIFAALLYIVRRDTMIEQAADHPVTLSMTHRILVAALLFILPMGIPYLLPTTPSEFDAKQMEQLQQLLR